MKGKIDLKSRFRNLYFWLGVIGVLFTAAGIDSSVNTWAELGVTLLEVFSDPMRTISVITAMLGVFVSPNTAGFMDYNGDGINDNYQILDMSNDDMDDDYIMGMVHKTNIHMDNEEKK